jgi:hypothetical protein
MDIRRSPATARNAQVRRAAGRKGGGNREWLAARATPGAVVFIGGATLVDFRIRVAQSTLRHDLLPSFWSAIGIAESETSLVTAPLGIGDEPSLVPSVNGVRRIRFEEFDDPEQYPNVAVIEYAKPADPIVANVAKLMGQRAALDVPSAIVPWLAFVWGAARQGNPLLEHIGLPSAALVETAFGMSGIELTPGLASGSSCPEAIWQSALWWHDYYRETADVSGGPVANDETQATPIPSPERPGAIVPRGDYWLRQEAAAVTVEPKPPRAPRARRPESRSR